MCQPRLPEDITWTGDPFVDVGALVMASIPKKTIEEKIRSATNIYVDHWKGKVDAVFLHSKLNNNHVKNKPELQRKGALEYYLGILKGQGAVCKGICRICCQERWLFKAGRNNYPLVGSGEFTNFHHFQESALLVCDLCLIKLYFLPLGVQQSAGNLMLLQFQTREQRKIWQDTVILPNIDNPHKGKSIGMLKAQNTLFYLASGLIKMFPQFHEHVPPQHLRLFVFTNFGSKPNVEIYDLNTKIFAFLQCVLEPDLRGAWNLFIKKYYCLGRKFCFNADRAEWEEKKTGKLLEEQEYQGKYNNQIYNSLLSGKTILPYLSKMHRLGSFPLKITEAYLMEVRNMRKEQIKFIQEFSKNIMALCKKDANYKKFIQPLNAKSSYELRRAILQMVRAHYEQGENEPFITSQDYIEYLFPDGQNWREVRDFLLICLYEALHAERISPDEAIGNEPEEQDEQAVDMFNEA